MGYAFNLTIPASGEGSRPINVSGATLITTQQVIEIAYDENGFNTGQYTRLDVVVSGMRFHDPQLRLRQGRFRNDRRRRAEPQRKRDRSCIPGQPRRRARALWLRALPSAGGGGTLTE